jgi:hypothetical protein
MNCAQSEQNAAKSQELFSRKNFLAKMVVDKGRFFRYNDRVLAS